MAEIGHKSWAADIRYQHAVEEQPRRRGFNYQQMAAVKAGGRAMVAPLPRQTAAETGATECEPD
jgi:hypothetical protein